MARVLKGSHSYTCTPRVHPLTEWTIPAFAFPAEAGTHLPTPEGWEAELLTCLLKGAPRSPVTRHSARFLLISSRHSSWQITKFDQFLCGSRFILHFSPYLHETPRTLTHPSYPRLSPVRSIKPMSPVVCPSAWLTVRRIKSVGLCRTVAAARWWCRRITGQLRRRLAAKLAWPFTRTTHPLAIPVPTSRWRCLWVVNIRSPVSFNR